jgi:RNA polymerase sigma-70 factor (ECF subfamily)
MQRELVERAMRGDHDAFAGLVDASIDRQYAVATLILRDPDRAQDAVQDALVGAWRGLRALRDPSAWDGWLYRLTVWACYRAARREKRRTSVEVRVAPPDDLPGSVDPSAWLPDRDGMERELDRLPVDQRAVVVLHFYLDLPLTEVAEILGIPVGTAKSRLHRGLEALRHTLPAAPEALSLAGRPTS